MEHEKAEVVPLRGGILKNREMKWQKKGFRGAIRIEKEIMIRGAVSKRIEIFLLFRHISIQDIVFK